MCKEKSDRNCMKLARASEFPCQYKKCGLPNSNQPSDFRPEVVSPVFGACTVALCTISLTWNKNKQLFSILIILCAYTFVFEHFGR